MANTLARWPSQFTGFPSFSSSSAEEVKRTVSDLFCEHDLKVVGKAQSLDTRLSFRRGHHVHYGSLLYGATVDIKPGKLNSFYLLQIPVAGKETIHIGSRSFLSTVTMASIISPDLSFHMRHSSHTEKLFIQIPRFLVEDVYCKHYGQELTQPLNFSPAIPLSAPPQRSLARLLHWQLLEAAKGTLFDHTLLADQLEESLVLSLLETLEHNHKAGSAFISIAPRFIRQAEDYMQASADQPLTVTHIAQAVGVSSRSLFAGFKKYRHTTPMRYLTQLRLHRVREALQRPTANTSVTDTALRWGFNHPSQFTATYKRYFHELPSTTLKRHQ